MESFGDVKARSGINRQTIFPVDIFRKISFVFRFDLFQFLKETIVIPEWKGVPGARSRLFKPGADCALPGGTQGAGWLGKASACGRCRSSH